jgi:hypothetical protein
MLKDHLSRAYAASALTTMVAVLAGAPALTANDAGLCVLEQRVRSENQGAAVCATLPFDMGDEPSKEDHSLPPGPQEMGTTAPSTAALSGRSSMAMFGRGQLAPEQQPVNRLPLIAASA